MRLLSVNDMGPGDAFRRISAGQNSIASEHSSRDLAGVLRDIAASSDS